MTKLFTGLLFCVCFLSLAVTAQNNRPPDSAAIFKSDSAKKAKAASDTAKAKEIQVTEQKKNEKNWFSEISLLNLIVVLCFFSVIVLLISKFFRHLRRRKQRIGYQSIKFIGLILIFPGICIIAIANPALLSNSTLAALLGTIAGYVLSRDDDSVSQGGLKNGKKSPNGKSGEDTGAGDDDEKRAPNQNDELKKKNEELEVEVQKLKDKIKIIKTNNPNLIE